MAITVSFTPDVASWMQGDAPITVSQTGTPTTGFNEYYWESTSGTFSNQFVASPVFTPNNATKIVSVIGRRVINFLTGFSNPSNFALYGQGGRRKSAGVSTTWDYSNTGTGLGSNDGFFQVKVQENITEKAAGLTANSSYADPLLTGTNSFLLCWHMLANGTAVPRKQGISLANPVFYKQGDVFRIGVVGTLTTFYYNGNKVVTTTTPAGNLYGEANFKTIGSIFDEPVFMLIPATNEGVKTLQVNGIFPEQPNYSYEIVSDNNTLSSLAEDGSGTFRLKGGLRKVLAVQFTGRPYTEYISIKNFWDAHQKHEKFYYRDLIMDEVYLMRFDTGLRTQIEGPDVITISTNLREV